MNKLSRFLSLLTSAFRFLLFPFRVIFKAIVASSWLVRRLVGYWEQPDRLLIIVAIGFVVIWALYWLLGSFALESDAADVRSGRPTWNIALYYSLISFTALGYGNWAPEPIGWAKWLGAARPFLGIISAVAFSISLTRRLSNRLQP